MHLLIGVRGVKRYLEKFIDDLGAITLPMEHAYTKGQKTVVELAVRPIQLYELVFPKEHLETVMATTRCWGISGIGTSMALIPLRIALGYSAMPNFDKKKLVEKALNVMADGIDCIGIGIKEDGDLIADKDIYNMDGKVLVKKGEKICERL